MEDRAGMTRSTSSGTMHVHERELPMTRTASSEWFRNSVQLANSVPLGRLEKFIGTAVTGDDPNQPGSNHATAFGVVAAYVRNSATSIPNETPSKYAFLVGWSTGRKVKVIQVRIDDLTSAGPGNVAE